MSALPDVSYDVDRTADRLVAVFAPRSVLHVSTEGAHDLAAALNRRGVAATGVALASPSAPAGRAAAEHLRGAVAEAPARIDLVACVGVLECLVPEEADAVLDVLCATTDLLVLSSTPDGFADPARVQVRPAGHWAALLSDRGFVRRFDVDVAVLGPWAACFERRTPATRALVFDYDSALSAARAEAAEKGEALTRTAAQLEASAAATERERELALTLLATRDAARGWEAQAGTATRRADRLQGELDQARAVIDGMRASASWKVGRFLTAPVRWVLGLLRAFR